MTVTKLEVVTKTKYKVFLDDCFVFILYKGELSRYGIKEGVSLGEEVYREILETVIIKRAKLRAMHLLEDMARTESGLLEKLKLGGYPKEAVEAAVEYVKSFGYLDDLLYAKNFIESKKQSKSRREIYALLCRKGVPQELIQEAFEQLCEQGDEQEAIEHLLRKKGVHPIQSSDGDMQKLYGYLARKGFCYEDIRQVIQNYDENT